MLITHAARTIANANNAGRAFRHLLGGRSGKSSKAIAAGVAVQDNLFTYAIGRISGTIGLFLANVQ